MARPDDISQRPANPPGAKLPEPAVYEQEYVYWPWGRLLSIVADWVESNAPKAAFIVDYMCGTGYLLNQLAARRPDLLVAGCSITPTFIDYAKRAYPHIDLALQDALKYKPKGPPGVVICTAGLHHLDRKRQPEFIHKVASELAPGKYFLLGEEVIADYRNEQQRHLAVVELWCALLTYAVRNDAPHPVLEAATDAFGNDLSERGEYKTSGSELSSMLEPHFAIEAVHHTWPEESSSFGDFLFVCRRR